MNHTLQNSFLQLTVNPTWGTWSLVGTQPRGAVIENASTGFYYTLGRSRHRLPAGPLEASPVETVSTPHGAARQLTLRSTADHNGLVCQIAFALPQDQPFLLIQLSIDNQGYQPVQISRLEVMNAGFVYVQASSSSLTHAAGARKGEAPLGKLRVATELGDLAFFSNGWQSWAYTGAYGLSERFKRTRLGPIAAPMRVNPGTPHPKRRGLFGSDMFGVFGDRLHRTGVLAGFLSQQEQFGSLEALADPFRPAMRMWANGDHARLDPGAHMVTDWACISYLHLDSPDPLAPYLDAAARQNNYKPRPAEDIPAGWCSWYHFYQKISEPIIRQNLQAAEGLRAQMPIDLFQIDDGFESQVGDWLSFSPAFPNGMAPLAAEISQAGFTPGLWLAPFIVHPKSRLYQDHPDWLLRNSYGRPVNAGYIWDMFDTALDITNPAALDYAKNVVHTASHEWGYPFLKLDFLYAAALPGKYQDPTKTRAQVMRTGLQALREAAGPDTFLLGCGCPLGPAIGLVDAMRIGPDVDQRWHPAYRGIQAFFQAEPDFPSARNSVHNTLTRAALHRRWWINDPDCLIVRPAADGKGPARLTLPEVQTLTTAIALSGGALLISEDLPAVPPERLQIAESLLPLIGKTPHVLDWMDSSTPAHLQIDLNGPAGRWHLVALFNWADRPKDLAFKANEFYLSSSSGYAARSFWDGKVYFMAGKVDANAVQTFSNVPAHGVVLLALRPSYPEVPQYLGSSLHISQGLEVEAWDWQPASSTNGGAAPGMLKFSLKRPGRASGDVDLRLPRTPAGARLNGRTLKALSMGEGVYRLTVQFDQTAEVEIDV